MFCTLSDFMLLLSFADALCLIQQRFRIIFFSQGDIGREVALGGVERVYPIPADHIVQYILK